MSRILVITPTYNERENLPELVGQLFALNIPQVELLVVDDNSPDGTGEVAVQLAERYPIHVLHRAKKEGIGPAYLEGMHWAIAHEYDVVMQIDCDLSHDPKDVPRLIEALHHADLVLGSRYVAGGGTENWSAIRKSISRLGSIYARMVLSLPYRDLTGGFKCFRADLLQKLLKHSFASSGYNFQIEMNYVAHHLGARIVEVPIIFHERTTGKSKFNIRIMGESFVRVMALRFHAK